MCCNFVSLYIPFKRIKGNMLNLKDYTISDPKIWPVLLGLFHTLLLSKYDINGFVFIKKPFRKMQCKFLAEKHILACIDQSLLSTTSTY